MLLPCTLLDTLLFLCAPGLFVVLVLPLLLLGVLLPFVIVSTLLLLGALLLLVIFLSLLLGAFLLLVLLLALRLLDTLLLLLLVVRLLLLSMLRVRLGLFVPVAVRNGLSLYPAAPAVRMQEQPFREGKTELQCGQLQLIS